MKVDAVRSLSFANNYSFVAREKTDKNAKIDNHRTSSMMTKVPVIVMLAMNPATLNATVPELSEVDNLNPVVVFSPDNNFVEGAPAKYTDNIPQQKGNQSPYGWRCFRYGQVQYSAKVLVDRHSEMEIVYYNPARGNNKVTAIYIVDPLKKGSNDIASHPPKIQKIIYHDLGKDKEYCSVMTQAHLLNSEGRPIGYVYREMVIDDDTANKIMAFTLDKTEWKNATKIEFQTTPRKELYEPEISYF